ncbi:hypothetical protein AKJ51_00680 [candidate division MSBL1 archaeon SCGC-AAA382A20]|uniref:Uncharacterized protein n=1 Tax=candidate division MSBL1 archaeon SCGC-AAA382A20 TaxID=1698280 RepID=A0A133VMH8_9EURY|nr:hypothetical protein AKJ51_00680 [candidate division MSBL1 archaeon SCGC-AAA382A20]
MILLLLIGFMLYLVCFLIDLIFVLIAIHLVARHLRWELLRSLDINVAEPVVEKLIRLTRSKTERWLGSLVSRQTILMVALIALIIGRLVCGGLAHLCMSVL